MKTLRGQKRDSLIVKILLPISLAAIAGWVGCDARTGRDGHHEERGDPHHQSDVVRISGETAEEFGFQVSPVGPAVIEETIALTGEVRANKDRLAHIVPRFGGVVTEVKKEVGDRVSSGEVLAIIESSKSLTTYSLEAEFDGLIVEKHATRGEVVGNDREIFVVADLSTVWVDLDVRMGDLPRVKLGGVVTVKSSYGDESTRGQISYITPFIDHKTRTAKARVVLANEDGFWRPGMFVTGELTLRRSEVAAAVPTSAIHLLGEKTVVFIMDKDEYRPRAVQIGVRDGHYAEVRGQIDPGEEVVVLGGFTLKSELLRDHFAGDHGH
jgi:membrane fusion protein, heavy metal efflux system